MMKLSVLGPEGVGWVDEAARTIPAWTGVVVPHKNMLDMFAEAGAKVHRAEQRVRIGGDLKPGEQNVIHVTSVEQWFR